MREMERMSLQNTKSILSRFDRFIIQPFESGIRDKLGQAGWGFACEEFAREYFESTQDYNRLMLSQELYGRFLDYSYILIVQLDALVLSDRLLKFCDTGYDYFGAPWVGYDLSKISVVAPYLPWYRRLRFASSFTRLLSAEWPVGNGGFSLRKTRSSLKVLQKQKQKAFDPNKFKANEDIFWSFVAPRIDKDYEIAPFDLALDFAFELAPETCFELNCHELPFGCHAYMKNSPVFWVNRLESLGRRDLAAGLRRSLDIPVN
jgi:hypothetical protein